MNRNNHIPQPLRKVVVLLGGRSQEREISLLTGKAVANALTRQNCEVVTIDWQGRASVAQLLSEKFDCAFIALHGIDGEDGSVQALLEILEIPYTGSGILASALCMDKIKTKEVLKSNGLPVLPDLLLDDKITNEFIMEKFSFPLCIKPVNQGSSVGVYKATNLKELEEARSNAAHFGNDVMIEPWQTGMEYTVGILNNKSLPSIWIEPTRKFYDFDAKYLSRDTNYHCPSDLPEDREREIQALAQKAFNITGCHDWGRVDFVSDEQGKFYILEVNTVPGLTDTSLVPKSAKYLGISFDALVLQITVNASLKQDINLEKSHDKQVLA